MAVLAIRPCPRCAAARLFADGRCVHCLTVQAAALDARFNRGLNEGAAKQ